VTPPFAKAMNPLASCVQGLKSMTEEEKEEKFIPMEKLFKRMEQGKEE
jgi:hypothetical protein